ncbi:MAG TPA: hypothetical protein VJ570_08120 [Holophagaceae bacterium]|nr:hypothetical protein [Holophagaceae bacterium]
MQLIPTFRRFGFVLGGVLLAALAGCHKSSAPTVATTPLVVIKGNVTFDRIPVIKDANGVPVGLETDPAKFEKDLVAKYVRINLYRKTTVPDPAFPNDRSKDKVFFGLHAISANVEGSFYFSVAPDLEWMLEVESSIILGSSPSQVVNVIGDPNGLASTVPQQYRVRYCMRKAPDGTTPPTDPALNHVATSIVPTGAAPTTVNFHIGVDDAWFLADRNTATNETRVVNNLVPAYSPGVVEGTLTNGYSKAGQLEPTPSGSRVLSILQAFADVAGYPPSGVASIVPDGPGTVLDVHYVQGRSEAKGTHVAWDRSTYPAGMVPDPITSVPTPTGFSSAYSPVEGNTHYFASVRGDAANDDAWDRSVLLTLAARCHLHSQIMAGTFFRQSMPLGPYKTLPADQPLPDLEAQMALLEGLPQGLAAVIQKSPYLVDTTSTGLAITDIRDLTALAPAQLNPHCAPLFSALLWEMALKAKALPSPGTPADWAKIDSTLTAPMTGILGTSDLTDTPNIYKQMKMLQASMTSTFTDTAIQGLLTQLGVPAGNFPWPRPTTGLYSTYVTTWGADPNSTPAAPATDPITPFTLSMAQATQVGGVYPNFSRGEIGFATFTLSAGLHRYLMDVVLPNGPLTNGQVEVTFVCTATPDGFESSTYTFNQSTASSIPIALEGPYGDTNTWLVRVRMLSPTTLQPDTLVKLKLVPAS